MTEGAERAIAWAQEKPHRPYSLSLDLLLSSHRDGDERGWPAEFAWLEANHAQKIADLMDDIHAIGIQTPILLGNDGRIWDGHHRIYAAHRLGLKRVPVVRAPGQQGSHSADQGGE